ncbi:relaxase/mobilization nuclease domain-containing protein [Paracoccus sp. J55]|uniref:relaxase/mobilization nuclease domain-containing protein n=1 Tax=Paracoccus sp. J55 TaxID=935849 RepID=UPI000A07A50B|nr:relaxase/mobilization nuclease domain-containing protein [Paracoccus sp. J55]
MKAKVERGGGFRGVLDYALGKEAGNACEIVGGNMSGLTPQELAAEFRLSREARPGVARPVWHTSLALPPGDSLTSDKWSEVAADFMDGMGLGDHQYVVIRHHDTDLDHVHIIASRIGLDGTMWHGKWEARQAIQLTQELEERHGLTRTKGLNDGPAPAKAPSRKEIEMSVRTGDAPPRLVLQQIVDAATAEAGSVFDFMDRIEAAGAVARPNVASTGKMNGFSFEFEGIPFKGSDLGKAYTWKGLQGRGITYDQERDGEALRERAGAAFARAGEIDGGSPDAADRAPGPAGRGPDQVDGGAEDRRPAAGSGPEIHVGASRGGDHEGPEGGRDDSDPFDSHADPHRGERPDSREGREIGGNAGREGIEDDRGAGQPLAVDGDPRSGSLRPADWDGVTSRTADLAAGAYPKAVADGASDPVSPAIEAKRRAWDHQHGALQAPAYRLTLMSRVEGLASFNVGKDRGPDGTEKTYDADEVRALIPYLSAHNSRGRDIYLTPMDPANHYMVVDDMTPRALDDFLAAGYRPALVQESSAGNRQAVLKVPKELGRDEQKAANAVVVDLNRRFGDPNFSGVIHPFRMAGFSNKKPGRSNAFTKIIAAAGDLCARAAAALDAARQRIVGERTPAPVTDRPIPTPRPDHRAAPGGDAGAAFDRARAMAEGLADRRGWTRDESRLDYRAAQIMAEDGWQADEIGAAIMARSPNLVDRHRDPLGYATLTAENACMNLRADQPEPQGDHPQDGQPEGPGGM